MTLEQHAGGAAGDRIAGGYYAERHTRGAGNDCEAEHFEFGELPGVEIVMLIYPAGLRNASAPPTESFVSAALHGAGCGMQFADLVVQLELWVGSGSAPPSMGEHPSAEAQPLAASTTRLGGLAPGRKAARAVCHAPWEPFSVSADDAITVVADVLILARPEPEAMRACRAWQPPALLGSTDMDDDGEGSDLDC